MIKEKVIVQILTMTRNITHVKIDFPDNNKVSLDIHDELTPMTCILGIKAQPIAFWYSNGYFKTNNGPLLSTTNLDKEVEKSTLKLVYVENDYNLESALAHIQLIARIIFASTSHPEITDCSQSVIAWMTRTYENVNIGKKIPTEQDYLEYFPESFQKIAIPKLVKYFDTLEGSVPQKEGIFIKIKIITKEKKEFIVDSTARGFQIEGDQKNYYYSTLYSLLCQNSEHFKENSYYAAARWAGLDNVEKTPYCPLNRRQTYSDNRKQKFLPQLRLFNLNNEILTGSVEDEINKINDNSQNQSVCINIEEQYMKQISKSIEKIYDGKVQPEIGSKNVYVDNGVRITKIDDINEYRSFLNYIKSIDDLRNITNKIKVERPIVVEYLGRIYIVKPRKGEDDFISKVTDQSNESIDFKKGFCDKFSCSEIPEGITGFIKELPIGDNQANCAILTYVPRTTPRDPNYPNDPLCLLRPEILRSYEFHVELDNHAEELISLGGDPKYDYTHNSEDKEFTDEKQQALNNRRNEIISQVKPFVYDINLTGEDLKNDKMLSEIGKFIKDKMIEKFVSLYLTTVNCPVDGSFLVQKMHHFGLNVRYLAHILPFLPVGTDNEKPMNKTFQLVINSEMIIRSFKHIVRSNNFGFDVLLEKINSIIQFGSDPKFDSLFESICEISEKKFGARPNKPIKEQIPYLKRGLMLAFGIVIGIKKGYKEENILSLEDVTEVIPHVKFCFTKSKEYHTAFNNAVQSFNNNDMSSSYKHFQTVIQLSNTAVPQFDDTLIDSFFYCALIFYKTKRPAMAFKMMLESAVMQERKVGFTDTSLLSKYNMLGSIAAELGNKRLSFVLYARVFVLLKLIAPFTPATIEITSDAADAASNFNIDVAYKFAAIAIEETKKNMPEKERGLALSTAYATAASIAISLGKLQLATNYADEAVKLNPNSREYKELRAHINALIQKQSSKRGGGRGGRRRGGH